MGEVEVSKDAYYLLGDQYRNSNKLSARAALCRQFSTAETRWQPWVFDFLALEPGMRVLECGCGPGWLWRENMTRIPNNCYITLTDLSPGMVTEAEASLAANGHRFDFQQASIQELAFADETFDVVVANHMLYHVADLPQALAEVRRVLKRNGRFIAATNGNDHLKELQELVPEAVRTIANSKVTRGRHVELSFRLENGRDVLEPYFNTIELHLYNDSLCITDVEPLLAHTFSVIKPEADMGVPKAAIAQLRQAWTARIKAQGGIHVSNHSGVFVAC